MTKPMNKATQDSRLVEAGYTAGQAASGRWWVACPQPSCSFYRSGLTKARANRLGEMHDQMHRAARRTA